MEHMRKIGNKWDIALKNELNSEYFNNIVENLEQEYKNYVVYPPKEQIFSALRTTDFSSVKVCILGQDPYHGRGQANGMAFAVCDNVPFPPSLNNIFKELSKDLGTNTKFCSTLMGWAKQGVLLLNSALTVRESQPQSHAFLGWERFTDAAVRALSDRSEPLVFILWGANAIIKSHYIASHHCVITSPHPSPLSAHRGFFGSKPFSKANSFLVSHGLTPIDWSDTAGNSAFYYSATGTITKV